MGQERGVGQSLGTDNGGHLVRAFVSNALGKRFNPITAIAISPDDRLLLSVERDGSMMKLWEVASRQLVRSWESRASVHSLAFLPDGRRILSAGGDSTFSLWDVTSGRLIHAFEGHAAEVTSLAISRDGRRILEAHHPHPRCVGKICCSDFNRIALPDRGKAAAIR